jgi:hypothetical protein
MCLIKRHAMVQYVLSGVTAPHILNLGTRQRGVVTSRPGRGKGPGNPLYKRLGWSQSRSWRGGEEKKSHHCSRGELNAGRPARSLVYILTKLSRPLSEISLD